MQELTERIETLKEILAIHPKGSHFCVATQQPGFALDADFLSEFIATYEKLEKEKEKFINALFEIESMSPSEATYGCQYIAREALKAVEGR